MSNVVNINFDDGIKKIEINGDSNRVLVWNPTDINFIDRYLIFADWVENEYISKVEKLASSLSTFDNYRVGEASKLGKEFNVELDKVFGEGTGDIVFGVANPISPISNGNFLFVNFINSLDPIIKDSLDLFEANSDDYVKQANKLKKGLNK